MTRTLVIAEAGVNHNGSLDLALGLVDAAADCGADIVKFQTFDAHELATASADKAAYQKGRTAPEESQRDMLQRLQLDDHAHRAIFERCEQRGIEFLSTAFDAGSLEFLMAEFPLRRLKLPSGEITNGPFLLQHARRALPLILSSGMCSLAEVEEALAVIAWGLLHADGWPQPDDIRRVLSDPAAWIALEERVTLLHCTSLYPTPPAEANLRAMDTLRQAFGLAVGYSDHTNGIAIPLAAVARSACVVEKHLTLDRSLPGPDHHASLEPNEFHAMVDGIRAIEGALGHGRKLRQPGETETARVARKSLVAARFVPRGAILAAEDFKTIRPGTGRSPMTAWDLVGTPATRDYAEEEPIGL